MGKVEYSRCQGSKTDEIFRTFSPENSNWISSDFRIETDQSRTVHVPGSSPVPLDPTQKRYTLYTRGARRREQSNDVVVDGGAGDGEVGDPRPNRGYRPYTAVRTYTTTSSSSSSSYARTRVVRVFFHFFRPSVEHNNNNFRRRSHGGETATGGWRDDFYTLSLLLLYIYITREFIVDGRP